MKAAILNPDILKLAMLDSAIIVFHLKVTHTCQDWFSPFAQKKLHSFSLTQLNNGSQLKFCHVGFIHFAKKKKLQSFILIQLDDGSHLEFHHLELGHGGFSDFAQNSDSNKFNLTQTYSFSLKLMMAAILNSAMLDWDTALLDSDTLLSFLRFTQKHSHSTLTLTQTNSIWLKLIQSHLTWWWQPSWILPSWIWPSRIQPW